jgi:predicted Zn-dependent protease
VLFGVIGFYVKNKPVHNPVTDETHRVALSGPDQVALGLQATPKMIAEYGGEDASPRDRERVVSIGRKILEGNAKGDWEEQFIQYQWGFHLLADPQTINAFALPGGQVFITRALFDRLQTEGELAGVLGHEIGHVIGRHSAEHIAKAKLTEGLTGAAVIATYDPDNPASMRTAQVAALIGQLINLKFGREDELESDVLGVCFMNNAGYDPSDLIRVMEVLAEASQGQAPPEFLSTHPDPGNRMARIQEAIQNLDQCPA